MQKQFFLNTGNNDRFKQLVKAFKVAPFKVVFFN